MDKVGDQSHSVNAYSKLEALLAPGLHIAGAVKDRKYIPEVVAHINTFSFTNNGLGISVRRYVDRSVEGVPDRDIGSYYSQMIRAANLPLQCEDGHKEVSVGVTFAVKPNGEFSMENSVGLPDRAHGPLAQDSWDMLIQLTLGNASHPDASLAPSNSPA